jgi:hypothetical protein
VGACGAIGCLCRFVSLVHSSLELIIPVFFGRNYTPVFSQKFPFCWSARYLNRPGACMPICAGHAGPPQLFPSQSAYLQANLSCTLPSPRFHLSPGFSILGHLGFGQLLMLSSEVFNGWQQELGVPTQDWSRGVGSLGLFRLSFSAVFPTCNHRRTLLRLVLNEGLISAIDSYTILSAQVEPKN